MNNAQPCMELLGESEEKFRKIAENSLVGMFLYREKFIYVNDAFARITGYLPEELLELHPWDLVEKRYKERFKKYVQRRLKGEFFSTIYNDVRLVQKNGEYLAVKITAETIEYRGGYGGIGVVMDITDIVNQNQTIKVLTQALSQSDDIIFITNIDGVIEYANDALYKIYGYSKDEVFGKTPQIFASGKQDKKLYKELWDTILSGRNYHNVIINKKKSGELLYIDTKITPVADELDRRNHYFVVTARDITQRVLNEEKFKVLATIDPLTEVPNRYQLNRDFDEFAIEAEIMHSTFSILVLDIDHFKQINDTYGHIVGDMILKSFATLIMKNIRRIDRFGRWGGEEFLLLLNDTGEHEAMQIAQKLKDLVANTCFNDKYSITISIGVTVYREGDTKEKAIARADEGLYAAKNLGRNRVVFN